MIFSPTPLQGSYVIEPEAAQDDRGWFMRFYCRNDFEKIDHAKNWVQLNHSMTYKKGTIRGMHFQMAPHKEIKMVKCVAGEIWDVIIDLRKNSPTFLQWFGALLSAKNKRMMYIPEGFAHGFQCQANNCELIYLHSEFYMPGVEGGIRFDDPRISIQWPLPVSELSARDSHHQYLDENFKGI